MIFASQSIAPSLQTLRERRERVARARKPRAVRICATGCRAKGALEVHAAFERELASAGLREEVALIKTGCQGLCSGAPMIGIDPEGIAYFGSQPGDVAEIVKTTLIDGGVVERLCYQGAEGPVSARADIPFFKAQQSIVLRRCGRIDPTDLDAALAEGAYTVFERALGTMQPEEIIETVSAARLRGRGGAGYPTGRKWELARAAAGSSKCLICNADEGDPGAFMDRAILEGDPHAVLEGMLIAAYAVGASEGHIYVRSEYPIAIEHVGMAIEQARAAGLLGRDILGSGFDFEVSYKTGAGAFVCGEETALIASIEGRRGHPRHRPPYPARRGLWGRPTNINNVETLAGIPALLEMGAPAYAAIGTEHSGGSKLFALAGKIAHTGLVEVPLGVPLRELVETIGGGVPGNRSLKAVQLGGPSGGCVPEDCLNLAIDYETVKEAGAIMGSGGMIVLDDSTCMVEVARYFMEFCARESCGKCTPCRIGTTRLLEILERICAGNAMPDDLSRLETLAHQVSVNSLCGLGHTAPNPVLSTMRHFPDEYRAHIEERRCPARACKALITYRILADPCTGCTLCAKACPVNVISGQPGKPHTIDPSGCIKCGACFDVCKFGAVEVS